MAVDQVTPKKARIEKPNRRAKTGCLNCRKKHKKCDEIKPTCTACSKRSDECEWPVNGISKNRTRASRKKSSQPAEFAGKNNDNNDSNLDQYAIRLLTHFKESSESRSSDSSKVSNLSSIFPTASLIDSSGTDGNLTYGTLNVNQNNPPNPENEVVSNGHHTTIEKPQSSSTEITLGFTGNQSNGLLNESGSNIIGNTTSIGTNSNPCNNQDTANHFFSPKANEMNTYSHDANTDCSPATLGESGNSYFSPSDSFTPFLLYNELHSTLRDFMFTSAELNEFTTTSVFNNIRDPGPKLFTRDASNNLQELLNNDFTDSSNTNLVTNANQGNTKVCNILKSKTELTAVEELELFKNYLYEVAPWLDMFDSSRQFGTTVANLAQNNKPLLYAVYAISSRQTELTQQNLLVEKSMKLYQESLKHLIPTVNKTVDQGTIATCVILCVLEMMSSSPKEWRHHLEGCHALFEANDIHGFSGELERRLFWCYARMDVNSAVIGEQSTIIPSENWIGKNCSVYDLKQLFTATKDDDMYANYIVFLCSRVLNLISKDNQDFEKEWEILWDEVRDWSLNRPVNLKPVMSFDDKPFPGLLFLNGPAISANQLFHMAIILLTKNKPRLYKIKPSECIKSPIWHAKQICAISIHNTHHGCWNNSLQPLWIAGKLLSSDQEHEIILSLLDKIEATTGWQMKFRKKDLKKYWNGLLVE